MYCLTLTLKKVNRVSSRRIYEVELTKDARASSHDKKLTAQSNAPLSVNSLEDRFEKMGLQVKNGPQARYNMYRVLLI